MKSSCVVSKGSATRWSYAGLNDSGKSQSEESVVRLGLSVCVFSVVSDSL